MTNQLERSKRLLSKTRDFRRGIMQKIPFVLADIAEDDTESLRLVMSILNAAEKTIERMKESAGKSEALAGHLLEVKDITQEMEHEAAHIATYEQLHNQFVLSKEIHKKDFINEFLFYVDANQFKKALDDLQAIDPEQYKALTQCLQS